MELGSGKSLKISYFSSVDLFSLSNLTVIKLIVFGPSFHLFIYSSSRNDGKATNQKFFFGGGEEKCPKKIYIEEIKAWVDCDEDETIEENLMQPSEKYMIYKQRVGDGQMSVTPQFWMIYMDLMEKQHPFNTAAQKGKFGGKMCA